MDLVRGGEKEGEKVIEVTPLVREAPTPYPVCPNKNQVRFTSAQVEAIKVSWVPLLLLLLLRLVITFQSIDGGLFSGRNATRPNNGCGTTWYWKD